VISLIKWSVGITLALAATGQLKLATLMTLKLAAEAQQRQFNLAKLSRVLTAANPKPANKINVHQETSDKSLRRSGELRSTSSPETYR